MPTQKRSINYGCSYYDGYEIVSNMNRIEPKNNVITWSLGNSSASMDKDTCKRIIVRSLNEISKYIHPISFEYVPSFQNSDIKLAFAPKEQNVTFTDEAGNLIDIQTPFQFDGRLGTLAMGFYPIPGNFKGILLFDNEETWGQEHDWATNTIDLETVATHEILHVLGMKHSHINKAVMFSEYVGEKRRLHTDDINGIRKIYKDVIYSEPRYDEMSLLEKIWEWILSIFR